MSERDAQKQDEPITDHPSAERETGPADDPASVAATVDLLSEENRRLRQAYARTQRTRYRRTAVGLALMGALAIVAGIIFPAGQEVLFVIGATGLFGGLLTYYVTPERFVAASTGERVYAALASSHAALVDELGLREDRIYLPERADHDSHLFVPQRDTFDLPIDRSGPVVTDEASRGLLVDPTGAGLYSAFTDTAVNNAETVDAIATQLADAIGAQFELARDIELIGTDEDDASGRVTVAVSDAAFGPLDRFDHPIPSFLAVGLATSLGRPVECSVASGDDRADWLVTVRWDETTD